MGLSRVGLLTALMLLAFGLFGGAALPDQRKEFPPGSPDRETPEEFIPGEVLLQLKPGASEEVTRSLAAQIQARVIGKIPEYYLYLLKFPAAADRAAQKDQIDEVIKKLQAHPQVQAAFPNYRLRIPPQPVFPPPRKPDF